MSGKANIADVLSLTTSDKWQALRKNTKDYIHYVADSATPRAMTTSEIDSAFATDEELCNLQKCHREGTWDTLQHKRYLLKFQSLENLY